MNYKVLVLTLFVFVTGITNAQTRKYIIHFRDKNNNSCTLTRPKEFLSALAIEKRNKNNISINNLDLPVSKIYIDQIVQSGGVKLLSVSKWLNQMVIEADNNLIEATIQQLPFVDHIVRLADNDLNARPKLKWEIEKQSNSANNTKDYNPHKTENSNSIDYGLSDNQIKIHQADFLHNHGFKGEGMKMAILDAGFYHYDVLPTFDSVRINNQILGTWDFVANEASVAEDNNHGMHCFSIIAANMPGNFVGSAPKTNFYLFRTEDVGSEMPIEEHNLAVAAERADSLGVDVCSISLGYNTFDDPAFDYTYADMNGNTSISAKAVDIAAKKGLLMVVSAGNEGNNSWHYICTPADADSCLTVGAVNSGGIAAGFSSYGPSSDGDIKPDVVSVGVNTVVANDFDGSPTFGSGTSYSCPNMAGIATCLWQAFPEVSNMDIIATLRKSGTKSENPDDKYGYGIPDAKKAFVLLQKKLWQRQSSVNQCNALLSFAVKTDTSMQIDVERKTSSSFNTIRNFHNDSAYAQHNFNFTDDLSALNTTIAFYRIKITIGSDTSYYIDSFSVALNNPCNDTTSSIKDIIISPTPFTTSLNVELNNFSSNDKAEIIINNTLGQKVFQQAFTITGNMKTTLPLSFLSKGIYFANIIVNNKSRYFKKIVKQ